MAQNRPVLDFIAKAIQEAQNKNRNNPNEETAHSSIFDMIKGKVQEVQQNKHQQQRGGQPTSIIDLIKDKVEEARQQNQKDPNVKTAPGSVFDMIKNQVDGFRQQGSQHAFGSLLDEYNLDLSRLDKNAVQQIHHSFMRDRERLRQTYALKIREITQ